MERVPALGELDASQHPSSPENYAETIQGGLSELDAAIAVAAQFAELIGPVPKAQRTH